MSEMLEKARKYEMEESMKITQDNRPVYHFSNPVGWMNDPNGFSEYKGEHHLFFQYYPYATHWDSMHWGHAKSTDFIKWEYLPTALAPDQDYDNFGVFSGSAIEDGEKQILIYTGVEEKAAPNGEKCIRQNQCVAIGNGVEYEKIENNPVVTADMLPEGSSLEISEIRKYGRKMVNTIWLPEAAMVTEAVRLRCFVQKSRKNGNLQEF